MDPGDRKREEEEEDRGSFRGSREREDIEIVLLPPSYFLPPPLFGSMPPPEFLWLALEGEKRIESRARERPAGFASASSYGVLPNIVCVTFKQR